MNGCSFTYLIPVRSTSLNLFFFLSRIIIRPKLFALTFKVIIPAGHRQALKDIFFFRLVTFASYILQSSSPTSVGPQSTHGSIYTPFHTFTQCVIHALNYPLTQHAHLPSFYLSSRHFLFVWGFFCFCFCRCKS